jgi:hypothetical protein
LPKIYFTIAENQSRKISIHFNAFCGVLYQFVLCLKKLLKCHFSQISRICFFYFFIFIFLFFIFLLFIILILYFLFILLFIFDGLLYLSSRFSKTPSTQNAIEGVLSASGSAVAQVFYRWRKKRTSGESVGGEKEKG